MTEDSVRGLRVSRLDRLVPWPAAALALGRSAETLDNWLSRGQVRIPALRQPGGLVTYQSWIDAVLAGARPGRAVSVAEVTDAWWADRLYLDAGAAEVA
jgi:hypothetical protein